MPSSALSLRINRQFLRTIGDTLDGVKTAMCVFDDQDHTVYWNRTFLDVFPEHAGKVFEGEPYRDNLHRFYSARLSPIDLPNIEQRYETYTQKTPQSDLIEHFNFTGTPFELTLPGKRTIRVITSKT